MSLQGDVDQLNNEIEEWDKKNLNALRTKLDALGVKHRKGSPNKISLKKALKSKLRKRSGLTDRISYRMPKSAVMLHKGVSGGHPITNPRQAKEWYTPVVNENIESLADIVAEGAGNLIINNLSIK